MAGVIQVSGGGDKALKPGGASVEVLLKPSGGVALQQGKGLAVQAKRSGAPVWECWGPAYALLVTTTTAPRDPCLQSTSEERMHVALVLPVHRVTEIATLQKMWNSE